ncbi:MAG: hypothetical protein HZA54_12610 [Planctomycetes bacterium]|nr:hypothetical protein [Planctomycetota bacterium]
MHADARLPTDEQREKLCAMMGDAFLEIRMLGWTGQAQQAADLADAFHNVPRGMWSDEFSLRFLRDAFLSPYQEKYAERSFDYVAKVDEIIGTVS